jgi:two-component system sensor histidine kinase KdpD
LSWKRRELLLSAAIRPVPSLINSSQPLQELPVHNAPDLDAVLKAAAQHIHSVFLSQVLLLLPDETGRLAERAAEVVTYLFDVREQAVSQWVFDHGRMAGKTTDTLPAAKGLYIPLRTSQGIVGVLGVHPADPQRLVAPEQLHLLEAFANQIALAIE